MSVLQIHNLSKSYGKIKALNDVSFNIPKGSVFGLLGPNGSGKTTLLSIVLDILGADAGSYSWFGEPSTFVHRKRIGSLLETPNFYHYLSAVQNLKVTQSISQRGNEAAIDDVLKKVNLFERRNSKFSTYSLGMKQRLAIAASLLGEPEVLLLDEPTNGLDPVGIAEIRELIKSLAAAGHTVIMASHLLDEVEKICDHVAILKFGKLIASGTVASVLADEDCYLLNAGNQKSLIELLNSLPGVSRLAVTTEGVECYIKDESLNAEVINNYCFQHQIVLNQLTAKKKRLEEKFFELTSQS
ncbi:MAG: ABC transporter ATP-binding protein [Chitinophagaceae bacterium]|jgi:ABC-2 type transport system ATP-binding protein